MQGSAELLVLARWAESPTKRASEGYDNRLTKPKKVMPQPALLWRCKVLPALLVLAWRGGIAR